MKRSYSVLIILNIAVLLASCTDDKPAADAYGHFESNAVTISSERGGKLLGFVVREGNRIEEGDIVGLVDTTLLALQRVQIHAKLNASRLKLPTIQAQAAVIEEQINTLSNEIARFENLLHRGASTAKQVDDLHSQLRVAKRQIDVQVSNRKALEAEIKAMSTELELIDDQVRRSIIQNPITGTVLHTYVEQHELVVVGKPLYAIASLDTLDVRVYVTGDQLSSLQPGMIVTVSYDVTNGEMESVPGTISHISPQAEFTPKFLQTREERTSMVYAVLLRVGNNGKLTIGMPAEVRFNQ
jgi:HlyD family secretion protein